MKSIHHSALPLCTLPIMIVAGCSSPTPRISSNEPGRSSPTPAVASPEKPQPNPRSAVLIQEAIKVLNATRSLGTASGAVERAYAADRQAFIDAVVRDTQFNLYTGYNAACALLTHLPEGQPEADERRDAAITMLDKSAAVLRTHSDEEAKYPLVSTLVIHAIELQRVDRQADAIKCKAEVDALVRKDASLYRLAMPALDKADDKLWMSIPSAPAK